MGLPQFANPNSFTSRGVREDHAFKVKSIIATALGDDFGKGVHKRTHLLNDQEDAVNIMTAVLLKFTTEEIKEFIGYFVQVDITRKTWKIKTEDEGKFIFGEALSNEQLKGLTVDSIIYKIVCEELIEEFTVSEKEKTKYILKSIEEI